MKNYAIVGFIYSQACPLSCNFCCHTKQVVGPGKLTPSRILPVILEFARQPEVTRFAFSGGDPFLFVQDIIEVMRAARVEGVTQPFHMVTSGYWATEDSGTKALLRELKEVGMDALDVSYDIEHARFVPRENIYRIGECCKALAIRLEIFGNFWNQGESVKEMLPRLDGAEKMYSSLVMPIGAAKKHFQGARYILPETTKYSCGKPRIYDVAIYPDGTAYPCCSGGFNKEAGLDCGNVFHDSARDVLRNVLTQFHARIAKEIGFDKLYSKVKMESPDLYAKLPKFGEVDSVCEICRDIHSNDDLMTALASIYEEMEIDYAVATAERDWRRMYGDVESPTLVAGE